MTAISHTQQVPANGKLKLLLLLLVVGGLITAGILLPVRDYLGDAIEWVKGVGIWGAAILVAAYVVACILMVPGSILTLSAGAIFGVAAGAAVVTVGSTLGAAAAFLVGRYLARDWIALKVSGYPRFVAIDEAVGHNGFKIVLLTRLSPLFPFNMLNYIYGLTAIRLGKYVLATWIGMIPATFMYVYLGSILGLAAEGERKRTFGEWAMYGAGLAATVGAAIVVARVARKALRESVIASQETVS